MFSLPAGDFRISNRVSGKALFVMNEYTCIAPDVKLGRDVKLSKFINLYGCEIGDRIENRGLR